MKRNAVRRFAGCPLAPWILVVLLIPGRPSALRATALSLPERPNVLLILVADLKPLLGCYGDNLVKSPNIDRLAAEGVVFDHAYTNQAVGAPARNSLMTGLRPGTLGIYDMATNFREAAPQAVTLPQSFLRSGWHTQAVGRIFHNGHGNHDDAASWSVPSWQRNPVDYALAASRAPDQGLTRQEAVFEGRSVANLPRGPVWECAELPDETYSDGKVAAEAAARLRKAVESPGTPFFLAVGFNRPRVPFCVPKKYWDLYDGVAFPVPAWRKLPRGAPPYARHSSGELRQYSEIPDAGKLEPELEQRLTQGYHAAVSYMDAQLGKVLDEMDRLKLMDKTIIVFLSDNGWHLGDHGLWGKHSNYEQATRIPLIIRAPGISRAGKRSGVMAESVDIYPTLLELAGLAVPKEGTPLEGRSLAPALRDPDFAGKDHILHVYPRSLPGVGTVIGRAIRTRSHRLVEWKAPGADDATAELELYDLEMDPEETLNLAASQPEVTARLLALLKTHGAVKPQIRNPSSVPLPSPEYGDPSPGAAPLPGAARAVDFSIPPALVPVGSPK